MSAMTPTTTWTSPRSFVDVRSGPDILEVPLAEGVGAWFTGRRIAGLEDANLAHHVPHIPERLASAREHVAQVTGTDVTGWHLMRQVHGADAVVVDHDVPRGAELRDVDILVTQEPDRALVVLAADCLPILVAGRRTVGAAHAGWRGIVAGVPDVLVATLVAVGEHVADLRLAIGPSIGPCCYAVGPDVVGPISEIAEGAVMRTREGRPSVDLRLAVRDRLAALGVTEVVDVGGEDGAAPACTSCDERWFSHRRDPRSGRQAGIVVRRTQHDRREA
jgi:YfiH family protein